MIVLATLVVLSAAFQERCFAEEVSNQIGLDVLRGKLPRVAIVRGTRTEPGEWPWQILLKGNGIFRCGGTLLIRRKTKGLVQNLAAGRSSRYIVITAAHCVHDLKTTYTVVVGEHNRSVITGFEQEIAVKKVVIHKKYAGPHLPEFGENDVAILFLEKDPTPNKFVKPIPRLSNWRHDLKALKNFKCFVLGWGDTKEGLGKPEFSATLLELRAWVISDSKCQNKLKEAGVDPGLLHSSNICTLSDFASFCEGDSGGTLLCSIDNIWTHVGIVSWTSAGCVSPYPNVYTRVSTYRRWIRTTEKAEN